MDILSGGSVVLNLILGGAMYLLKGAHADLKESVKDAHQEISKIKETTIKKEDFREFKTELFDRLDKMETIFARQKEQR